MPRVIRRTKNKAGAKRECGKCHEAIEPGDKYLTWSFRYGGTYYRCLEHPPRPSDLTQSKMSEVYSSIEGAEDDLPDLTEISDITSAIESVAETAQGVADEYREAAEAFGGEGENAERADQLEEWVGDLEAFAPDEEDIEDARNEATTLLGECSV